MIIITTTIVHHSVKIKVINLYVWFFAFQQKKNPNDKHRDRYYSKKTKDTVITEMMCMHVWWQWKKNRNCCIFQIFQIFFHCQCHFTRYTSFIDWFWNFRIQKNFKDFLHSLRKKKMFLIGKKGKIFLRCLSVFVSQYWSVVVVVVVKKNWIKLKTTTKDLDHYHMCCCCCCCWTGKKQQIFLIAQLQTTKQKNS